MTAWVEGDNALLAPGKYTFSVVSADQQYSQQGNLKLVATFQVELPTSERGQKATQHLARFRVCQLLKALGFPRQVGEDGKGFYEAEPEQIIGKTFDADVSNVEGNEVGRYFNKLGGFRPPSEAALAVKSQEGPDDDCPF